METAELQTYLENTIKECNLVIEKWKSEQLRYKGYAIIPEKEVQGLFFTKTRFMIGSQTNRRTWNYRNKYKNSIYINLDKDTNFISKVYFVDFENGQSDFLERLDKACSQINYTSLFPADYWSKLSLSVQKNFNNSVFPFGSKEIEINHPALDLLDLSDIKNIKF